MTGVGDLPSRAKNTAKLKIQFSYRLWDMRRKHICVIVCVYDDQTIVAQKEPHKIHNTK